MKERTPHKCKRQKKHDTAHNDECTDETKADTISDSVTITDTKKKRKRKRGMSNAIYQNPNTVPLHVRTKCQ